MIELKEHNKEPYEKLCRMLSKKGKCAYISATGTGKSYVIGKYIEEHDLLSKTLLVVPNMTIERSWKKLLPGLYISTYQGLTYKKEDNKDYELIVCDEMHHLGGESWGRAFEQIVDGFTGKVIGVTATPIRYLDSCRDMAEKYFQDCIVHGYSLAEAIDKGILPSFQYVAALYNLPKSRRRRTSKYTEKLYKKLQWMENEYSVKSIFDKHMPKGNVKAAVFVDRIDEVDTIRSMMKKYYPDALHITVHSMMNRPGKEYALDTFEKSKKMSFLYTVNILNEGVHVKEIQSIIMFRRTCSPAIYMQQIGRCLSNQQEQKPVIFDLVANYAHVRSVYRYADGIKRLNDFIEDESRQIIIQDYAMEELDILQHIRQAENGYWTEEEDEILREHYKERTDMAIIRNLLPERTSQAIIRRIRYLNLSIPMQRYPDNFEEDVKEHFLEEDGVDTLMEMYPGAKRQAILRSAKKQGLYEAKTLSKWSEQELEILRQNGELSPDHSDWEELLPGRTKDAITAKKRELGIVEPAKAVWTEEEDEILRKYRAFTARKLKERFFPDRTISQISYRKNLLGVANGRKGMKKDA